MTYVDNYRKAMAELEAATTEPTWEEWQTIVTRLLSSGQLAWATTTCPSALSANTRASENPVGPCRKLFVFATPSLLSLI